jgi:hypothetical protein
VDGPWDEAEDESKEDLLNPDIAIEAVFSVVFVYMGEVFDV